MEKVYLCLANELDQNNKFQKYQPYFLMLLGLLYIVIAVVYFNLGKVAFGILWLWTGIGTIFFSYTNKNRYLEINVKDNRYKKSLYYFRI